MFCYHCGANLDPGTQFCPHCGAAVQAGPPTGQTGGQPGPSAGPAGAQAAGGVGARPAGPFGGPSASRPAGRGAPSASGGAAGPYRTSSAGQPGGGVCTRCGARLEPGSLFCDQCGTMTSEGVTPPPTTPSHRSRKPAGRRGLGKKAAALIAVGALLVVSALALVVVPMVTQLLNPSAYLAACAGNTLSRLSSASEAAADTLGVAAILDAAEQGRVEQQLSVGLKELPESVADYSTRQLISDAVLSIVSQSDLENRQAAAAYTLALGGMDLMGFTLALDDDLIALNASELWGNDFYGLHTETLGADFNSNPLFQGMIDPDVGFNLFDALERWQQEKLVLTDETLARIEALNQELLAGLQVEREGTVNAVIPADRIRGWVRGLFDAVSQDANLNSYFDLALEGSGMALSDLVEMISPNLDEALSHITEDVTLVCTVTDNYISQMTARTVVQEVELTLGLEMGGGAHPMDGFALSLDMEQQGSGQSMAFRWTSRGNHSAQGGVYSDESQLEFLQNGTTLGTVSWSTYWEPEAAGDNFSWTLSVWDGTLMEELLTLNATGAVTVDRRANSLSADFSDLSLTSGGETLSLWLRYSIAPCDALTLMPDSGQVTLLPAMSQEELEDLMWVIEQNAQEIAYQFYDMSW